MRRAALPVAVVVGAAVLAPGVAAAQGEVSCTPKDPGLAELSGLTVIGDTAYAVGDSGADDRVAQLDSSCAVTRWIPNPVDPYDVEDLASIDGRLVLADIGDNDRRRDTVGLVRLDPASGAGDLARLTYPDGAHDAEALLIGGDGRPVLVTKDSTGSGVYTTDVPVADLPSPGPTALRRVAGFVPDDTGTPGGPPLLAGSTLVTGGAVTADGTLAAVRTYTDVYLWSVPDGDVAGALSRPANRVVAAPARPQGEAAAFTADGDLLLASEQGIDPAAPLPPIDVLRAADIAPAQTPDSTPVVDTEDVPAEPSSSILGPLVVAAASVLVIVGVTAVLVVRVFRRR
ncbi:hypothetical protein [Rhodococcoides corynebacterioides]|uniref:hypothetical protein n=1 Tax=Rhodococcoides corynebacterioides TaxID=53972 RepID=UPI0027E166B1|nr:hypothetical protein [Rhodococcus corynebacterioides]